MTNKIGVTEINEFLINSMTNSWSKKAYVQGFDRGSINFNKPVNIFERMKIAESIYKGVVGPSYKEPLGHMPPVLVTEG